MNSLINFAIIGATTAQTLGAIALREGNWDLNQRPIRMDDEGNVSLTAPLEFNIKLQDGSAVFNDRHLVIDEDKKVVLASSQNLIDHNWSVKDNRLLHNGEDKFVICPSGGEVLYWSSDCDGGLGIEIQTIGSSEGSDNASGSSGVKMPQTPTNMDTKDLHYGAITRKEGDWVYEGRPVRMDKDGKLSLNGTLEFGFEIESGAVNEHGTHLEVQSDGQLQMVSGESPSDSWSIEDSILHKDGKNKAVVCPKDHKNLYWGSDCAGAVPVKIYGIGVPKAKDYSSSQQAQASSTQAPVSSSDKASGAEPTTGHAGHENMDSHTGHVDKDHSGQTVVNSAQESGDAVTKNGNTESHASHVDQDHSGQTVANSAQESGDAVTKNGNKDSHAGHVGHVDHHSDKTTANSAQQTGGAVTKHEHAHTNATVPAVQTVNSSDVEATAVQLSNGASSTSVAALSVLAACALVLL